jgi:predicted nucleic acid-binding protein
MLVIADATPLHYLVLIDEINLLRELYKAVVVPSAVVEELSAPQAPVAVHRWVADLPSWISIAPPQSSIALPFPTLGDGEREAIALAGQSGNSLLLTDDQQARLAAESLGIRVVPTIRVLSTASALSLVDLEDALKRLQQTNFRVSRKVLDAVLNRKSIELQE